VVPKSKRRNSWPKRKKDEKIELLMEVFQCKYENAKSFVDLIKEEDYTKIVALTDKGGADVIKKRKRKS
jgi:hypothetical protein